MKLAAVLFGVLSNERMCGSPKMVQVLLSSGVGVDDAGACVDIAGAGGACVDIVGAGVVGAGVGAVVGASVDAGSE